MAPATWPSAAAPAVLMPSNRREPKWYAPTARATSAVGAPAMPTRNSWPTRWASLIRRKTLTGQGCGGGPPEAAPGGRVRADPELDRLAEGCGVLLADIRAQPEQVKPSDTAPASSARAGW